MNHFENLIRLIENLFVENARFFEYYVRILELKIGYNLIRYMGRFVYFLYVNCFCRL